MERELHQTRSLSAKMSLDQILGINGPSLDSEPTNSGSGDKSSPNPSMRPPTRHGRESASSNEENKDPVVVENGNGNPPAPTPFSFSTSSTTPVPSSRRRSEDDFIKKLNEMRRASLISTMDEVSNPADPHFKPSTLSSFMIDVMDSPKRDSRPRLEITVEEAEPAVPAETAPISADLSQNSIGSSEQEGQSLTFRVEERKEEKKQDEPKKEPTKKASLSKRPVTGQGAASSKIEKKNEKKEANPMMKKSMFNNLVKGAASEAHHEVWLRKKQKELRARKLKEKQELDKKHENEEKRRENAAKLYERWAADHDEKMRKFKIARNLEKKEAETRKKTEKEEKLKEAAKTFEMWKKERSKSAHELRKRAETDAEAKRNAEAAAKIEKEKEARTAFLAWKRQKEEFLSAAAQKLRREEREKREKEDKNSKDFRFLCATEAYETWMEMKDKEREMLSDLVLIEAPPIPWIPPSNLVPRHFVRSAHGNRPKTRSQSAKPGVVRSKSRPSTTTSLRPFR